jgi:hypothetical protein
VSDHATRAAERRAKTGGLKDAADALAARMRSGEVSWARVEWAARLGHEVALAVVGKLHPERVIDWSSSWWDREHAIRSVCELLHDHWQRPLVAFAADCAERVLLIHEKRNKDKVPRRAIEAARAWVACPSPENAEAAARAASAAAEAAAAEAAAASAAAARAAASAARAARAASAAAAEAAAARAAEAAAAASAARAAEAAAAASAARAARAEYDWQRLHLAAYALGEISWEGATRGS